MLSESNLDHAIDDLWWWERLSGLQEARSAYVYYVPVFASIAELDDDNHIRLCISGLL